MYGHSWCAPVAARNTSSCGVCRGGQVEFGFNDLASQRPDLLEEWDYSANTPTLPDQVHVNSSTKRAWKCTAHGHTWNTAVSARSSGNGCPFCSKHRVWPGFNDFASQRPELVAEWDPTANGSLRPQDVSARSSRKIHWKCAEGHSWISTPSNRFIGTGCTKCKGAQTSKIEVAFFESLTAELPHLRNGARVLLDQHCVLKSWSIDILGKWKGRQLAIEYDGSFYHQDNMQRDLDKTHALLNSGYVVVRIREIPLTNLAFTHPNLLQIPFRYPATNSGKPRSVHVLPTTSEIIRWLLALP